MGNLDILHVLSQLGFTLLGFSGLVVAFREHTVLSDGVGGIWSNPEKNMLWAMVLNSLAVALFSLIPSIVSALEYSIDTAVRVAYLISGLYTYAIVAWWFWVAVRRKSEWDDEGESKYYVVLFLIWLFAIGVAITFTLGAAGYVVPLKIGVFALIAWLAFFCACVQFLFFVARLIHVRGRT